MGHNQHVAGGALSLLLLLLPHDGGVPFLPDLLDEPVKALRDVRWAPVAVGF